AVAVEGMDSALERVAAYARAGADMIFPEALSSLDQYRAFKEAAGLPVLANLTEFGLTPPFTCRQLAGAGVDMALYPLSASRAMNRAALTVLESIREKGTQADVADRMMTRVELYDLLGYEAQERKQRHG
ncbi:MAG TPA: isocitrate lyase/phosphoenolpyruvate mutase family protein, partial [Spirochaetia bacterium]|nr:isocitrate lyase/phosphoenolpyruvate mutase family protein [Spirochaetia bacterium]